MAQITVTDLALGYDGRVLLEHLNLTVNAGDYLCIIGENGSGKSTFIRTLIGLQKPLSGNISFGEGLQQNEIGYLPQQTEVQRDFPASVREIVLSGCQGKTGIRPFYNKQEKEMAEAHMEEMGISHLAHRCYRELSGGQQQRVLLARALCATAKVLLLDEPVAGLDPKATEDLYTCIADLNRKGITILMVSHDLEATRQIASHILHIGNHVFFGTKEEYLQKEQQFWRGGVDQ